MSRYGSIPVSGEVQTIRSMRTDGLISDLPQEADLSWYGILRETTEYA